MAKQRAQGRLEKAAGIALQAAPWVGLIAMTGLWRRALRPKPGVLSVEAPVTPASLDAAEPGRGRLASSPLAIPPLGWKDIFWRTYREIGRDRLPAVAGGVTFYTLLALFPAIGVFVSIYGMVANLEAVQQQLADMSSVFPREVVQIVGDQMIRLATRPQATLSVAFVVSLLLSLWTANAGMKALFDGVNIAYDEAAFRPLIRHTAVTYLFTFGAVLFLVVMTGLLIALPLILERVGLAVAARAWIPLRWLILWAMAAGAFALLYRVAPHRRPAQWRWLATGAVLAAGAWLGGSLGFSWYLNNIAHFDATYGSLGAAVAFMTWVWFSVMVVLLGAELNAETEHQTAQDTTIGPPAPLGERRAVMADSVGKAFHLDVARLRAKAMEDSRRQAARVRKALKR